MPSSFNLLQNGAMTENMNGWSSKPNATDTVRGTVMYVAGNANSYNFKSQTVQLSIQN